MRVAVAAVLVLALLSAALADKPAEPKPRLIVVTFDTCKELAKKDRLLGTALAGVAVAALAKQYELVDRATLDKALRELELEEGAVRDDREAGTRLGKRLRAKYIVTGRASSTEKGISLSLRVLVVQAGRFRKPVGTRTDRVEGLPKRVRLLVERSGLLAKRKPDGKVPPATAEDLIKRLTAADRAVRFDAAIRLGGMDAPNAVAPLVKVLKGDRDTFVRRAAARSLASLHAISAVPDLIETLGDREYFVAVAAGKALFDLTRHEFGYKDGLSRDQVEKLVESAKAWWKKNEAAVRARRK
ncbi:MAG: HEAT repeat domain-containing protein [Planctomycetota bacterium]|jgi:TolB-like protein